MPQLILENIQCYETTDGPGEDEAYITIRGKNIWSADMNTDDKKPINKTVNFERHIEVQLWEEDSWPSNDDFIGRFTVYDGQQGRGEQNIHLYGDGGHYEIYYKVN